MDATCLLYLNYKQSRARTKNLHLPNFFPLISMFLLTFISVPNNLTFKVSTQMNNQQQEFHVQLKGFSAGK